MYWEATRGVTEVVNGNGMRRKQEARERVTLLDRFACGLFSAVSVGLAAGLLWGFWMVFFSAPPEYFSAFVAVTASLSGIFGFFLQTNIVAEIIAGILDVLLWFFGGDKK
jgi:hypothetical protein